MQNAMPLKNAPRMALGASGRSRTLETVLGGVYGSIFGREQYAAQDARLTSALRGMVLGQIEAINEAVGEQMLYVNECAEHLFLYGRPAADRLDKLMMLVPIDIDGLARLWCRLQGAMEGV